MVSKGIWRLMAALMTVSTMASSAISPFLPGWRPIIVDSESRIGPVFSFEPEDHVNFTNSSGAWIRCSATGHPTPSISWVLRDGTPAINVTYVREVFANGTLVLPPFRAEDFRPDVHTTVYQCVASNAVGVIVSRFVNVRAVVVQHYSLQVHDVTALQGNAAIFQCSVPHFVRDHVLVTSWTREEGFLIRPTGKFEDTKYTVLPSGELCIRDVQPSDHDSYFRCQTINRLTGESRNSDTFGRLIVTRAESGVAPKIMFSKAEVVAEQKQNVVVPCVAEGHPVPEVGWHARLNDGLLLPIHFGGRMEQIGAGLLIKKALITDSGAYVCIVRNGFGEARSETAVLILAPLSVSIHPSNQSVDVGQSAMFRCVVTGHPVTTVRWLKNAEVLPTTGEVLRIAAIKWSDAGQYQCMAENSQMTSQGVALLQLGDLAPEFSQVFEEQVLERGDNVTLVCTAIGSPAPHITWLLDDIPLRQKPIKKKKMFKVTTTTQATTTLIVPSASEESTSTVEYIVNDVGIDNDIISYDDDEGKDDKEEDAGYIGKTNSGGVNVASDGDVDDKLVSWVSMSEHVDAEGGVVGTLRVTSVDTKDGGMYRCVAANRVAQAEYSARINIHGPLAIRKMSPISIVTGDSIRIPCPVYGYPIDSIHWWKDGEALPQNLRQTVFSNGTLVVEQVGRVLDAGHYTCVASNDQGDRVREAVQVKVLVAPKIIPFSFQGGHLFEGVLARVSCVVYQGDLPFNITWLKDGRPLAPEHESGVSVQIFDEYSSILSITQVAPKHSGSYTCVVKNRAAEASHTAELVVNVPPRWKVRPLDTSVVVGHDAIIHCEADGFPTPSVSWMWANDRSSGASKNIVESGSGFHLYPNGSLLIRDANEAVEGYYFCRASNDVEPSISAVSHLSINFPASTEVRNINLTTRAGDSVVLSCKASGNLPINFTWSRQGIVIGNQDGISVKELIWDASAVSELTVAVATRNYTTSFQCTAENSFGADQTIFLLTVLEQPEAPSPIVVEEVTSRTIKISWIPPFNGNSKLNGYVVQYAKANDGPSAELADWSQYVTNVSVAGHQTSLQIEGLLPASVYFLRIYAHNAIGTGTPSETIAVITKVEAPSGSPLKIRTDAPSSKILQVCWEHPKKSTWNGILHGYHIGSKVWGSTDDYMFKSVTFANVTAEDICANITGLKKFIRYSVVVQAFNEKGSGPMSEEVMAMTAEGAPVESPTNLTCKPKSSENLEVSWNQPPLDSLNGILQGYKIIFAPSSSPNKTKVKTETQQTSTLEGLEKFTNYTIEVLAFTRGGDGISSHPVVCQTMEDVPGPAAAFRAMVKQQDSVLVAWKVPTQTHGVIIRYNIHVKDEKQKAQGSAHWAVPADDTHYEVTGLKENHPYSFWVTASTMAGEGQRSKVVTLTPKGPMVPAQVVSFDADLSGTWKQSLTLPCKSVGIPLPERRWMIGDKPVKQNSRIKILPDGSLYIKEAQGDHSGNYSCQVRNEKGKDRVKYSVHILAPPSSPHMTAMSTTKSSITLEWEAGSNNGNTIKGYILSYRRGGTEWEHMELGAQQTSHDISGLECGATYEFHIRAYNDIGKGDVSQIVSVVTNGSAPALQREPVAIEEGLTSLILHLDKLTDIDNCPINHFNVEYKPKHSNLWLVVPEAIQPEKKILNISDLLPATWYNLRLTAHSTAGMDMTEYEVATLALNGGKVPSNLETTVLEDNRGILFYIDLRIVIPVAAFVAIILLVLITMCVCVEKKKETNQSPRKPVAAKEKANGNKRRGRRKNGGHESTADSFTYIRQSVDPKRQKNSNSTNHQVKPLAEDLTPYATYHLMNGTELQTFQQRSSAPVGAATDSEEDALDGNSVGQGMQFMRPKSYTPAESPSPSGKKKLRQVAIPTAPPVPPSASPTSRCWQGQSSPSHLRASSSRCSTPSSTASSKPKPPLPTPPPELSLPSYPASEATSTCDKRDPDKYKGDMSPDELLPPPMDDLDVSPVYTNVVETKEFLQRLESKFQ